MLNSKRKTEQSELRSDADQRGNRCRTNRASRLKTILWLGGLALAAGCAVWAGLNALPEGVPKPPQPSLVTLEARRQNNATPLPVSSPTPPEAAPTPEPPRVPVLEDAGGYPVMARLEIEAVGLELPVIAELSDEALKTAPCLYAGPGTPEDVGNIVIVGHNYRNDSHFGRLDEVEEGDAVLFIDKYGGEYRYTVSGKEIVKPEDTGALDEYEGDRALSLLTCTSSGRERLLVRCKRVGQQDSRG